MAVTHSVAARNAATDAVTALIGSSGFLKFRPAGSPNGPVATLALSTTAFGAASNGTATANAISSDTNAAGGNDPVAVATIETSGGVIVIQCGVAASGSDVDMSNGLTVAPGDTVSCSSLTYTALPA